MHRFLYGSRVIENERTETMKSEIRKTGSTLRQVVKFFVMLVIVILVNLMLRGLARHADMSLNMVHMVQDGFYCMANDNPLSVITFLFGHLFSSVWMWVCCAALGLIAIGCKVLCVCSHRTGSVRRKIAHAASKQYSTVSYRFKVCFLS